MDQIHCFIFNPNDAFDPSQPTSKHNSSYILSLGHTQTIVSPILPGTMIDMSIGSHGTIIYMDSDIDDDDIPMSAGQGQRLAGNHIDASTGNKDTQQSFQSITPPSKKSGHVLLCRKTRERSRLDMWMVG